MPPHTIVTLSVHSRFGTEFRMISFRSLVTGTFILSISMFDTNTHRVHALLTPTTPTGPYGLKERPSDPVSMYLNDVMTVPVNLAGLPALSLPIKLDRHGLPISLQLIGSKCGESSMFHIGK